MAFYHQGLKYHEDTTQKHQITQEEIKFLKELQKEMNTQDHLSQADPRFWVIKGTEKEYGVETGYEDGADLVDEDCCEVIATDMESAMQYIRDNLLDEINETDGVQRSIVLESGIFHPVIEIRWPDEDIVEDSIQLENMEQVADWLKDEGYRYEIINYKNVSRIYPDTMFLTQKSAEDHLRKNYYHYSDDAHTYAMTAWRDPVTEKLYKILQQVDWTALEAQISKEEQNETTEEADTGTKEING